MLYVNITSQTVPQFWDDFERYLTSSGSLTSIRSFDARTFSVAGRGFFAIVELLVLEHRMIEDDKGNKYIGIQIAIYEHRETLGA